ncbi:hypothetical protein [Pelagovum pacificum]|uniref:DUF3299 domain-containing protein n=1 Tax=Pelagovum pacificum TaxID=2588711 RepID=A0A5C5GK13_9RHOB|nr:hypothetical protein [Pelagovum pacificum]QQA43051.1 hypothetical protein I8N54_00275 [Pelagovum pacificum]TNY33806.1 hypothetical protein FHY64_11240 [Pelagovum pacificum]
MQRRHFLSSALATLATPALAQSVATTDGIRLRELYDGHDLSPLAQELMGQRVSVMGFMAPPLKAESQFFVLTKMPMAVCPFCESSADWPNDILAVYTKRTVDVVPFNVGIYAEGILEYGEYRDPETGFVSMVRLVDSVYA